MENMEIYPLDSEQMNAFYLNTMGGEDFFYREEMDKLHTFHLLKNIYNQPSLILTSTSDNSVFTIVNRHMMAFITIIFFTTILLGILLYQYIDRCMIKRMRGITDTMNRIEGLEDLSIRIEKDRRKDEISNLISSLNFTLDKLENEKVNRENVEKAMMTQGKLASIGKLSSNIAHEINNPILAISNSIQVLKKNIKRKSELVKDAIEISETEIDRIRKIISGLLDFHRSKKEFTSLNIKEVILQTLEVLKWSHKLKSTKIIHKMGKDCFVYGSSVKLEEVFMNLILNAVEAMEDMAGKSKLKIEALNIKEKNSVEIHFIDNGPGLAAEVRNSLFEPFVSTKENTGVGLGLYIAYKLVNIHHGDIIYNEEYKEGAHFIIKLPASRRSLNG
jgi:signal transduction histidine kinase